MNKYNTTFEKILLRAIIRKLSEEIYWQNRGIKIEINHTKWVIPINIYPAFKDSRKEEYQNEYYYNCWVKLRKIEEKPNMVEEIYNNLRHDIINADESQFRNNLNNN